MEILGTWEVLYAGLGGIEGTVEGALGEASLCLEGETRVDTLMSDTWLFARETVRQLGGRVCGKRRKRAGLGSELKKDQRALAVLVDLGLGGLGLGGLGTGSGEVVLGEAGLTPENRDGRGLSVAGLQAPGRRDV